MECVGELLFIIARPCCRCRRETPRTRPPALARAPGPVPARRSPSRRARARRSPSPTSSGRSVRSARRKQTIWDTTPYACTSMGHTHRASILIFYKIDGR